ncbi:MAG: hypothetical protein A2V98_07170 [Planctomycetes bacterium RBG_16_64_12]|nr:MAG: hypothetical protein A2V98_07170 [Planctomycetes bacterium RBG_16_64_12]
MIPALTAALAVGFLAATGATSAPAVESFVTTAVYSTAEGTVDQGVRTVGYSTSDGARKVEWLPYRPSEAPANPESRRREAVETQEQFAEYTVPVAAKPAEGGAVDPFNDPFEDAKATSAPLELGASLHDRLLEGEEPRPLIIDSLPQIAAEEKGVDSDILGPPGQIPESLLEESLAAAPREAEDPCASIQFKSIHEITHDTSAKGDMFPRECPLVQGELPGRATHGWTPVTFTWKASGLCHKPPYFEDVQLERYGHSFGPYLQPVVSGAHFFLTVPILPYKMGLYPPGECIYSLGYYRPGSCAPYMLDPLPISIRAGLAEAGVWTGMAFLIP